MFRVREYLNRNLMKSPLAISLNSLSLFGVMYARVRNLSRNYFYRIILS